MIRAARLAPSRPMYAFDPNSWTVRRFDLTEFRSWAGPSRKPVFEDGQPTGGEMRAVWFRRKAGKTLAAMGVYRPHVLHLDDQPRTGDYQAWVDAADDNRYGGDHWSSWDGQTLLTTTPTSVPPELAAQRIEFLTAMLAGYPDPPPGFDGWWTFPKTR